VRKELGLDRDAPVVGVVGRLETQKGHVYLIDAWPEVVRAHPDARLVLVGEGSLRDALTAQVRARGVGDSVMFTGFRADVPRIIYPLLLAVGAARRRAPAPPPPTSWPFLTVIVAAYNEAACIEAKLASALGPGYPRDRLEVIVVSDGSTDATDRLVAAYPDPRVVLIRQEPRAGKSPALNRGVGHARGDVLVFTDANALFAEDALRR